MLIPSTLLIFPLFVPIFVIEDVIQNQGFCRYHLQLHIALWADYSVSHLGFDRINNIDLGLTFRTSGY